MSFPLKLTVFTNVYNEEYMLPFWLEHHKGIFDHGVVFDWDSTDSSMDIVRKVCPTWEIIKAPQKYFDAYGNDVILMNEEMKHTGYKMVLNTTEFLISPNPIRQYLSPKLNSYYMRTVPSVLSTISYQDPRNLLELFSGIERVCIGGIPITDRAKRCIHSYNHGHYSLGRHRETLPITEDIPFYTIWFGFYPWNPKFHQRKLQIKDRIPMSDIEKGSSRQHMETQEGNEYRRRMALDLSTPIHEVPFLKECLEYSMLTLRCAKLKNKIQFIFGNCFPFSPFSAAENKNTISEAELLSINLAERLANENYDVTIFADKDSIGHMNDGVFVNKVWYKNLDSLFSLQELDVVILHGYSGIHTWAHLRRLNLPKKMLCVYISGDLSAFDSAFPTSFKMLQNDSALFCLQAKNQLQMKFCSQLNEKEICFVNSLPYFIDSTYYNMSSLLKISKNDWLPYNHYMYLRNLKERGFEPKVIYDIGSCVLHWTNKAKEIWPDATYILFDGMREAEFLYCGYQYHMGVLCDEDNKELKFYKNVEEPGGNSYYREIGHPNSAKIFPEDGYVVERGMTLDSIVKQKGFPLPDLIKMDIQGAEKDVLQGGQMVQSHAKHLIVEMQHENYNDGAPKVFETGSYIESLGWTCCAPKFSVNYADADYGYERI